MTDFCCPNCSSKDPIPLAVDHCPACQKELPFPPNVREAQDDEELRALELRVSRAETLADAMGCKDILDDFGNVVQRASAVLCRPLGEIMRLVADSSQMYATYYNQINGQSRLATDSDYDEKRRVADAQLFSGYHERIVFAALTLDGLGPEYYGPFSIVLRDEMISHRTTVFEGNTVIFCRAHGVTMDKRPKGYRASWQHKDKLAKAKLYSKINKETTPDEYPTILLDNSKKEELDEFIEVNIYKGLTQPL